MNHYDILGLRRTATIVQIRQAYYKLCREWHPDRNPENLEEANRKTKDINEAYRILRDIRLRADYDAEINIGGVEVVTDDHHDHDVERVRVSNTNPLHSDEDPLADMIAEWNATHMVDPDQPCLNIRSILKSSRTAGVVYLIVSPALSIAIFLLIKSELKKENMNRDGILAITVIGSLLTWIGLSVLFARSVDALDDVKYVRRNLDQPTDFSYPSNGLFTMFPPRDKEPPVTSDSFSYTGAAHQV